MILTRWQEMAQDILKTAHEQASNKNVNVNRIETCHPSELKFGVNW